MRTLNKLQIVTALVLAPSFALARPSIFPPVDPGKISQDRIREQQQLRDKTRKKEDSAIKEETPQDIIEDEGAPAFSLNGIRFTRSKHLDREQLEGVVKAWLGKDVTFATLQKIVAEVNALYHEQGIYTATATLPEQNIEKGMVTIQLVEGSLGRVDFEGNNYTNNSYLREYIDLGDQSENIDIDALENDILFYNRLHSERLQAELRAGKSFGLTDIVVQVGEQPRDKLQLDIDNYGYESTGEEQFSALYQRQQLLLPGDRSLAYAQVSKGIHSLSLGYNAPINTKGWRAGTTVQYTDTTISGDFSAIDVKGNSWRIGLETSYLAYSTPTVWVNILGAINHTSSDTTVSGQDLSQYKTLQYQVGGEVNWVGQQWQFTGRQLFSQVDSKEKLVSVNRKVKLYNTDLTFIYNFEQPFYALSTLKAQFTSEEAIPGAISFSLGGPTTIRGYKPGIVSGDKGWYNQLELHYNGFELENDLGDFLFDVFAFYDYGKVESLNPEQQLASVGAGMTVSFNDYLQFTVTAANATRKVTPNQKNNSVYAKLTCQCLPW